MNAIKKYLAEFIGTFVLVFFACSFLTQFSLRRNLPCLAFIHPSRRIADRGLSPQFPRQGFSVRFFRTCVRSGNRRPVPAVYSPGRCHRACSRPAGSRSARTVRRRRHPSGFFRHPAVRPQPKRTVIPAVSLIFRCFRDTSGQIKPPGILVGNPGRCPFCFCILSGPGVILNPRVTEGSSAIQF